MRALNGNAWICIAVSSVGSHLPLASAGDTYAAHGCTIPESVK
jgi:hypothetical protein